MDCGTYQSKINIYSLMLLKCCRFIPLSLWNWLCSKNAKEKTTECCRNMYNNPLQYKGWNYIVLLLEIWVL